MNGRLTLLAVLLALLPTAAHAYRPFDGTDADVAEPHEIELEIGPLGYQRDPSAEYAVVPNFVFNYGFRKNWELVVQTRGLAQTGDSAASRFALDDTALLVKHVLREGTLQEKTGASVAMEVGLLFPSTNSNGGSLGVSVDVITSYRWSRASVHLNLQLALTPAQELDLFAGVIAEGPISWRVRPVGEIFVETQTGGYHAYSLLLGVIWHVRENFDLDLAARVAAISGADTTTASGVVNGSATGLEAEVRCGFSWGIFVGRH